MVKKVGQRAGRTDQDQGRADGLDARRRASSLGNRHGKGIRGGDQSVCGPAPSMATSVEAVSVAIARGPTR
jgi:hypothetical protein